MFLSHLRAYISDLSKHTYCILDGKKSVTSVSDAKVIVKKSSVERLGEKIKCYTEICLRLYSLNESAIHVILLFQSSFPLGK